MKRSLRHRMGVLALACTFVLASGKSAVAELGCLDRGDHHGHGAQETLASGGGHAPDPAGAAHGGEGPAGPANSGHPEGGDPDPALHGLGPSGSSHHDVAPCFCVGSCQPGGGVAMGDPGSAVLPSPAVAAQRQRRPGAASGPRPPTPRLLPFANAPPLSR